MPWPIRLGPPPRMMTLSFADGALSSATSPAKGVWRQAIPLDLGFHLDDGAHLGQKPRIDLAGVEDVFVAPAKPHRLRHLQQPVRRRRTERCPDRVLVVVAAKAFDFDLVQPGETGL